MKTRWLNGFKASIVGTMVAACMIASAQGAPSAQPRSNPLASAVRQAEIWERVDSRLVEYVDRWFEDGDLDRVLSGLRLRYAMWPNDYEVVTDLGWILESMDKADETLGLYIRFRLNNPKNVESAYPEAEFYFRRRQFARVPALLEPRLSLRPHPNNFRILAHSYERMGMLRDSLRVWELYLAVAPDDTAAKNNRERVRKRIAGENPAR